MKNIIERASFALALCIVVCALSGCFAVQQLQDKAREEQLLKPGALDARIPLNPYYVQHTFKLMGKYHVTHEWLGLGGSCGYGGYFGKPPGLPIRLLDSYGEIYERDGHTYLKEDPRYTRDKDELIDRYVKSWYETDNKGVRWQQGLMPMCLASWYQTQHAIEIDLQKQNLEELLTAVNKTRTPDTTISTQRVGNNTWHVVTSALRQAPLNGSGGPFQSWILPIGDTGYIFVFGLGANLDSLKYPEAHARMQEVFQHLIESVKIDPLVSQ